MNFTRVENKLLEYYEKLLKSKSNDKILIIIEISKLFNENPEYNFLEKNFNVCVNIVKQVDEKMMKNSKVNEFINYITYLMLK